MVVSQENGFRTNQNTRPSNLDLFLRLDEAIEKEEARQDILIGFWHISREHNTIADGLAKQAAKLAEPVGPVPDLRSGVMTVGRRRVVQ